MSDLARSAASELLKKVEVLCTDLKNAETCLEFGYASLGNLLVRVQKDECWREGKFESFNQYLTHVGTLVNRGNTQVKKYFYTVRELHGDLSDEQLNQIGISKANELKSAKKRAGFLPASVVEEALKKETTIEDVRRLLHDAGNPTPISEGVWYPLEGFYCTAEEKATIQDAFEAAWRTDPQVQPSVSTHIRRKEALLRLSMEYLSTHSDAVEQGEA